MQAMQHMLLYNLNSGLYIVNMITQKTTSVEGQEFTFNCSDLKCNWILIHNGIKALIVEDVSSKNCKLETRNTIFEASSKEECIAEIKRLGLEYEYLEPETIQVSSDEDLLAKLKANL